VMASRQAKEVDGVMLVHKSAAMVGNTHSITAG